MKGEWYGSITQRASWYLDRDRKTPNFARIPSKYLQWVGKKKKCFHRVPRCQTYTSSFNGQNCSANQGTDYFHPRTGNLYISRKLDSSHLLNILYQRGGSKTSQVAKSQVIYVKCILLRTWGIFASFVTSKSHAPPLLLQPGLTIFHFWKAWVMEDRTISLLIPWVLSLVPWVPRNRAISPSGAVSIS